MRIKSWYTTRFFKAIAIVTIFAHILAPTAFAYQTKGSQVRLDTTNFDGGLSSTDTDVQKALETMDELTAGAGQNNTASNVGTVGTGLFKQKTGSDLEFYKINSASAGLTINLIGTDRVDIGLGDLWVLTTGDTMTGTLNFTGGAEVLIGGQQVCLEDGTNCPVSGGGSSIILDLADDGSNESTGITEIATTGDTNGIVSEPSANKVLFDMGQNWPTADTANAGDSATSFFSSGQIEPARGGTGADTSGYSTGILGYLSGVMSDIDTLAELNSALSATIANGPHTTDTGPAPDCTGTTTYQDGEGNCDDLSTVYQPLDADLTTYAGITPSANIQSLLAAASYAAVRVLLDLEVGVDFYAPADAEEESHASEHLADAADEILGESLGTACTIGQVWKSDGDGTVSCAADNNSGGGSGTNIDVKDGGSLVVNTGTVNFDADQFAITDCSGDACALINDIYVLNTGDTINGELTVTATLTVNGSLDVATDHGRFVSGGVSGFTSADGIINSLFSSGDESQYVALQAGSTGEYKSYFAWYPYNDTVHDWLMGRNATNDFILYDANATAHRMEALTGSHTFLSSAGSGSVIVNGHSDGSSGTGGFSVSDGGGSPSQIMSVTTSGLSLIQGNLVVSSGFLSLDNGADSNNFSIFSAGSSADQIAGFLMQDYQGNNEFGVWKQTDGDFEVYDYTAFASAIRLDVATHNVGINNSSPSSQLDVNGDVEITGTTAIDTNTLYVAATANRVGVGTTTPQTVLDIESSDSALRITRLADPAANITTPRNGMIAYDSTDDQMQAYVGGAWVDLGASAAGGNVSDNTNENITGVWEIQDNTNFALGNDADWTLSYDETTNDQLRFSTLKTSAVNASTPMFDILVDSASAGMTADALVFAIRKGGQSLFTIDEDGDAVFSGSVSAGGSGSSVTFNSGGELQDAANSYILLGSTTTLDASTGTLIIENGTNPAVDAAGKIGIDSTKSQFLANDGTNTIVMTGTHSFDFDLTLPVDGDFRLLKRAPYELTITGVHAIVDPADTGESVVVNIQECTSTGDSCSNIDATAVTADNDGATDDGTIGSPLIEEDNYIAADIGAITTGGTLDSVHATIYYTINRK